MEKRVIRVLVADSTRMHSQLLANALGRSREMEVIASVSSVREVLDIVANLPSGVALVSSSLDQEPFRGFELVRQLRSTNRHIRCVMLLDSSERESVVEAFRAGAQGVFSKNDSQQQLVRCIRCVQDGGIWATPQEIAYAMDVLAAAPRVRAVNSKGLNLLSKRELEVVQCLSEGLTNREIGKQLGLSRHTVKNYLLRIFDKLGASNRMELLFLTLSQPVAPGSLGEQDLAVATGEGARGDDLEWRLCLEHDQGLKAPRDPAAAYMWCLVAERKARMKVDAISVLKARLEASLNGREIKEGFRKADEWLNHKGELGDRPRASATQ